MTRRPRIIAESSLPYLRGVIEELGDVQYIRSDDFNGDSVRDADWLIIRSITKCTPKLLEGTSVQLITTATIGYDHIDTDYCTAHGIRWYNSPGCNAGGVGLYAGAVLSTLIEEGGYDLKGKTMGIVGAGHTGMYAARYAEALGMRVLLNDPPRAEREGAYGFVSLETIAEEADIVEFHLPLTHEGRHATYHICDENFIRSLKRTPIVTNYCRGPITDTRALLIGLDEGLIDKVAIDCWEGEPHISHELLDRVFIGTPHIAGFSADGKANGARMCVENGLRHFGLTSTRLSLMTPPPPTTPIIDLNALPQSKDRIAGAILSTFRPRLVDKALRADTERFEELRRTYDYPREPLAYTVLNATPSEEKSLRLIGFECQ